jgi:hypothetical protein
MHCQSRRLIDHKKPAILKQNTWCHGVGRPQARPGGLCPTGHPTKA